jgi:hypothetical protein
MRARIYRIGLVLSVLMVLANGASATPPDTVVVLGNLPTVVAFVGATKTEVMYSSDWSVIVADFRMHLDDARAGLEQLPVVLLEVFSPSVRFRARGQEWPMMPGADVLLVGYFIWSPQGQQYICRGAISAVDLVDIVTRYLEQPSGLRGAELNGCALADA